MIMKNSKRQIKLFFLLIVFLAGCGVGKEMVRTSGRKAEKLDLQRQVNVNREETMFSERAIAFADTSRKFYRITIFPQDTFTLSDQFGFRGRAQRIEISGSVNQRIHGKFHESNIVRQISDSSQSVTDKSKIVESTLSKEVKGSSFFWFIALLIGVALVLAGLFWKLR